MRGRCSPEGGEDVETPRLELVTGEDQASRPVERPGTAPRGATHPPRAMPIAIRPQDGQLRLPPRALPFEAPVFEVNQFILTSRVAPGNISLDIERKGRAMVPSPSPVDRVYRQLPERVSLGRER